MSDRLREIEVFVRAAETGSFSRAARELGLSQPSASRLVSQLEGRLGVTLLLRTTRQVRTTEAGRTYLENARRALAELEQAQADASGDSAMRGLLRVALSTGFGCREIVPRLPQFLAGHPGLRIELVMADQRHDLVAEGADVALRLGAMPDSAFIARRIARAPRFVVAAPSYLAARGTPAMPADLAAHDCIIGPGSSAAAGWVFRRGKAAPMAAAARTRIHVTAAEGVTACARGGARHRDRQRMDVSARGRGGRACARAEGLRSRAGRSLCRVPGGPSRACEGPRVRGVRRRQHARVNSPASPRHRVPPCPLARWAVSR